MDVAITGASGLIGTATARQLRTMGHRVRPVVRRAVGPGEDAISWDPAAGSIDAAAFEGIEAVVHLAGAGIADHRWSAEHKARIRDSRTRSTALLSETLASLGAPPRVLLSGSAIGFYGDRGDEALTEASTPGNDFLAGVCRDWEAATGVAEASGIRVVHLRTGIVLSKAGGAFPKLKTIFGLGLGGRLGSGKQHWSWISLADEVAAIVHLLDSGVSGPVNLTAPQPVTNAEFTRALAKAMKRPALFPVPRFGPGLLLGAELAQALLFNSQRVLPQRLQDDGFTFSHPELPGALTAVLAER